MRFPFFNNPKVEPKPTVRAPIPMRRSSLADTQPLQRLPGVPGNVPPPAAATPAAASGASVRLGIASLIQQLPQQLFTDAGRAQLDSVTLSVPAGLLLPQLSTGKVSVKLDDLIPLFPANVLRSPLPPVSDQQCVVFPLQEVIAAIPPDLLALEYDSEISADDPELNKLPKLIDDALMNAAPASTPEPAAPEKPQASTKPSDIVIPPRPKTNDAPEYVMVSLRALVAVMPDAVFCCPRTQLATKVNLDSPALLPTEPIIPQLRTGTVKLPLSIIVAMFPHQVLANPMPALEGQTIPIPLAEIIPQLPKNVFTDYLRELSQESEVAVDEIPDPFHEKSALAEAPATEEPAAQPFVPELAVEEAALTDDNFSIFTEREPSPSVEPVAPQPLEPAAATPAPEPEPEPQVIEPVAEIATPVEPVAETVSQPEPVVEPVAEVVPVVEPQPEPVAEPIAELPEPVAENVSESVPTVEAVSEPEPVVEPVAEVVPVVEPVAETVSEPEPVAEPVAELPEPVAEPVAETVSQPEPVVEPVAEVAPVVEPQPEPVAAAAPQISEPVAQTEPEVTESVAAESESADQELSAEESATETPAVDERKLLVDLNRCSVEDLVTIPGVGRALAQRIVDFRNSRGKFSSVNELRQVPGIGRKTYRALAGIQPRALNRLLGAPHDGELTLQEIVRLTGKLPGIEGCMLATSDGLFLAGELPPHLDQSTISVFAPQLFRKVGRYARELKVGSIRRFTIFTDTQPISIFRAGDVYLIVIHDAFRFSKALLRRCERISQEIARLSSQRVTV